MIERLGQGRPAFLASVTTASEADLALRGGADIIDCKDPSRGALGALERETVRAIVTLVMHRVQVSATIGDLPSDPDTVLKAAKAMAATGVHLVKIGFFGDLDPRPAITALRDASFGAGLVAVLMADRDPDFSIIGNLAEAGFCAVMLDTANKSSGRLVDVMTSARLTRFVERAHAHGLHAGLAGSLTVSDIAPLASLGPDVIGFRGALCADGRASSIAPAKLALVRSEINSARAARQPLEAAAL